MACTVHLSPSSRSDISQLEFAPASTMAMKSYQTLRTSEFCTKKIANSARVICTFCAPLLQILRNISTRFSMVQLSVTLVCTIRISWLVGPLKLKVTIQPTLSLRLLTMTSVWLVYRCQPVSVLQVQSCTLRKKINKWYTV